MCFFLCRAWSELCQARLSRPAQPQERVTRKVRTATTTDIRHALCAHSKIPCSVTSLLDGRACATQTSQRVGRVSASRQACCVTFERFFQNWLSDGPASDTSERLNMAGNAAYSGAVLVACAAILLSFVTFLPVAVDRVQLNTASLSRELQAWRASGQYYVHTKQDTTTAGIFYIDDDNKKNGKDDSNTLLLLHGFPSSSYDFAGIFWEGLKSHYSRIIVLDFLGYGFSDKPRTPAEKYSIMTEADVTESLLQYLEVHQVHILAHDIGDTIAQEMLARFNDRTAGLSSGVSRSSPLKLLSLCFLNGGLFPEQHRASTTQKLLNNNIIGPIISSVSTYRMFVGSFAPVFGPKTQPSKAFLQDTYTSLQFNGGKLILPQLLKYMAERRAYRDRWVGALIDSKCPIGLINGPADPISGGHAAERYKELVPKPWVYMLEDHIGHYPHVEAPHAVLRGYKEFCHHVKKH